MCADLKNSSRGYYYHHYILQLLTSDDASGDRGGNPVTYCYSLQPQSPITARVHMYFTFMYMYVQCIMRCCVYRFSSSFFFFFYSYPFHRLSNQIRLAYTRARACMLARRLVLQSVSIPQPVLPPTHRGIRQ